jgi:hypothetical protein
MEILEFVGSFCVDLSFMELYTFDESFDGGDAALAKYRF